jgi:Family of unknown function (DUF6516)
MITLMTDDGSDNSLAILLELHGVTAEVGGGFWISMKARRVEKGGGRPHGIQYALTLHRPGNERIVGYDNAHSPKIGSGPSSLSRSRALAFDHRHFKGKVTPYEFGSPEKLLEDFWLDVEKILKEEGIS